eukprot:15474613-Alexandrium_andersonii.AAC.1
MSSADTVASIWTDALQVVCATRLNLLLHARTRESMRAQQAKNKGGGRRWGAVVLLGRGGNYGNGADVCSVAV